MAPEQRSNFAFRIINGLGPGMRAALMDSFKLSLIAGKGAITVQIFLASLYRSSPSEVAAFFVEAEPLQKLARALSSIDVSVQEIRPARTPDDHSTKGIHSGIDPLLVDLLTKTVDAGSGRESPADVADFMSVVSNDPVTAALLRDELGLILKSHPA
jgi:hypothetical protein